MNSPFTMVFMIILVVIVADLIKSYMKRRKEDVEETELKETLSRMDVLEERIRVLERIVTESRYDLKKQIDNL